MDYKSIIAISQKSLRQIVIRIFLANFVFMPAVCLAIQHGDSCAITVADKGISVGRIIAGLNDKIAAESLQKYLHTQFKVTMDIVEPRNANSGRSTIVAAADSITERHLCICLESEMFMSLTQTKYPLILTE